MNTKSLKANISWLAIIKVFNILLPLITLPHLTANLGTELFGAIAIGFAIQQVVVAICDYGFSLLAPKLVAEKQHKKEYLGKLLIAITFIKTLFFVVVALTTLTLLNVFVTTELFLSLWGLMLIPAFLQSLLPLWFFLGMEKMVNITIVNIVERSLYTVLIFALISTKLDAMLIPKIMILSQSIALVCSVLLISKFPAVISLPSFAFIKALIYQGWGYFYSRLTLLLFSKFNVIIVGASLGEAEAGFFSLAERIYNAGRSMLSPLTDALYPYMVSTKNWSLAFKIVKFATLLGVIAIITSHLFSHWFFINLFGSEAYAQSASLFNILIFGFSFSVISMLIGYPVLGAMGQARYVNRSVLFGAILHLIVVASALSVNLLSSQVLVISLVLTELTILSYRLYFLSKNKKKLTKPALSITKSNNYGSDDA